MAAPTIPLRLLAHARSGDKGNKANIGVVCHDPAHFAWLETHLTAEVVADHFSSLQPAAVTRFPLPNLAAFNFVLEAALGGGASQSLRWDSQGKALAAALLERPIPAPPRPTSPADPPPLPPAEPGP